MRTFYNWISRQIRPPDIELLDGKAWCRVRLSSIEFPRSLASGDDLGQRNRDPAHFRPNGLYLSEAGQCFLFELLQSGHSIRSAAACVGVPHSTATYHYANWLKVGGPDGSASFAHEANPNSPR